MSIQETEVLKQVELQKLTICLLPDNMIKMIIKEQSVIDLNDVKEIQNIKRELVGEEEHTVLFITPKMGTMTREARDYSSSQEVTKNALGKAIVLNGLAIRIITNFFINFNKPAVEHRAFENEKDATEWLRSLKGARSLTGSQS